MTSLFGDVVIGVLLSSGDGTFEPVRLFPATLSGRIRHGSLALHGPMTSGDYDRDGHADIAYASWFSDVGPDPSVAKGASPLFTANLTAFMFGDGQGGLRNERVEHFDIGEEPTEVVVDDFDGDGVQDIATSHSVPGDVSILLGAGDGTFAEAGRFPVGTQPVALAAGSLDPGGTLDLVVVNAGSADASVLLGNGDGTFGAGQTLALDAVPAAVTLADVNGDAVLDLAIAQPEEDAVSIYAGLGDGTFHFAVALAVGDEPVALVTADLDGNGAADLVVVNVASTDISVLLGVGDGTFQPEARHATGIAGGVPTIRVGPRAIATADLNRDGFVDVIVGGGSETRQLVVLNGDGQGGLASPVVRTVGRAVDELEIADLDGNGWDDLITADRMYVIHVLLGDGEGFSPALGFAGESRGGLAVGEFNRDGLLDLAAAGLDRRQVAIIPNRLSVPIRFDSPTTITWRRLVGYDRFNTYRGDLADLPAPAQSYGACLNASDPDLTDHVWVDAEAPAEGAGYFYLMSRVRDGVETDLGTASNGQPRAPAVPCE